MPRSDRRGAGPAPARWHGRPGAGANGGSAALDGMQGRGAALDIALAELAFELGEEVPYPERSAATPGRSAPGCRRNARRYRPRASTSSPASAAVAGAPGAAPAEMTEQAKHCALPVDRLRHMVVHARRQAGFAVGQRGVGGHGGIGSRRSARRRGFSGSPRDHRYPASACPSAPRRTARSPPAPAERASPPSARATSALAAQQLGGDLAVQRVVLHYQQTHARNRWVRPPGAAAGWPSGALFAVQRLQHRVGQLLGRDRLGEKIDEGRRAGRIGQHLAAIGGDHDHHGRRQVALQLADQLRPLRPSRSATRQSSAPRRSDGPRPSPPGPAPPPRSLPLPTQSARQPRRRPCVRAARHTRLSSATSSRSGSPAPAGRRQRVGRGRRRVRSNQNRLPPPGALSTRNSVHNSTKPSNT